MVAVPRRLKELHRSVARAAKELANELGHAPRPKQIVARPGISRVHVSRLLRGCVARLREAFLIDEN